MDPTGCWLPVPEFEVPWLREHGATDDQIDAMCRRSVQAAFEAAAGTAGGRTESGLQPGRKPPWEDRRATAKWRDVRFTEG
jgi:hypothetical protein